MASSSTSIYRPLECRIGEIRLLTVKLPAKDHESGPEVPLDVELSYSPIAEASYHALSYTWGDESNGKKPIRVNGVEFDIGANLYRFLLVYREYLLDRRDQRPSRQDDDIELILELTEGNSSLRTFALAHVEEERQSEAIKRESQKAAWQRNIPIWIDAICIDQSSIPEKNEQIPRMKDIYSLADAVIVWLGEADATSEKATRFLRKLMWRRGLLVSPLVGSRG